MDIAQQVKEAHEKWAREGSRTVRAAKYRTCVSCGGPLPRGTFYTLHPELEKWQGIHFTQKECLDSAGFFGPSLE